MADTSFSVRCSCQRGIVLFLLCFILQSVVVTEKITMRLVEEPSNYGNWNQDDTSSTTSRLHPKMKPANITGPQQLKSMAGLCFEKNTEAYKYVFCPFHNVTQHEQVARWNPYSGILGIWQEWKIVNNTFKAMVMKEGDNCAAKSREVDVYFHCGFKDEVLSVEEPSTCHYVLNFSTPHVCHPHSMLVYPTLSEELRDQWDKLATLLHAEEITPKGYNKRLHRLFEEAGYVLKADVKRTLMKNETDSGGNPLGDLYPFTSLDSCNQEHQKLKQEFEVLKAKLQEELDHRKNAGMEEHMVKNVYEDIDPDHYVYDGYDDIW